MKIIFELILKNTKTIKSKTNQRIIIVSDMIMNLLLNRGAKINKNGVKNNSNNILIFFFITLSDTICFSIWRAVPPIVF